MFSFCLWPALRAALVGGMVVGVSLPLVFAVHSHFELGAPPTNGLWTICLGIIGIFVGAAWIGLAVGTSRSRPSGTLAAFGGWVWGVALALALASSYGKVVASSALRDAHALSDQNRDRMEQSRGETPEQARAGHASRDAALAGTQFSDDAREATIGGAARLPAMSLLVWALLVPPALSALECRRARRDN